MQSYTSYYMVSPQTVFTYPFHHAKLQIYTWCHRKQSTYPFHHAKLQILLHGVTANSLYSSFSPCKATNLYMVSPQTVFTYPLHHAKLQILLQWCHRKQSLLILFTVQSYKSYYMVSPQTVFTYPFHHAKLQILLHGVTANSLYLSFSPCKATNISFCVHSRTQFVWRCSHQVNIVPLVLMVYLTLTTRPWWWGKCFRHKVHKQILKNSLNIISNKYFKTIIDTLMSRLDGIFLNTSNVWISLASLRTSAHAILSNGS